MLMRDEEGRKEVSLFPALYITQSTSIATLRELFSAHCVVLNVAITGNC